MRRNITRHLWLLWHLFSEAIKAGYRLNSPVFPRLIPFKSMQISRYFYLSKFNVNPRFLVLSRIFIDDQLATAGGISSSILLILSNSLELWVGFIFVGFLIWIRNTLFGYLPGVREVASIFINRTIKQFNLAAFLSIQEGVDDNKLGWKSSELIGIKLWFMVYISWDSSLGLNRRLWPRQWIKFIMYSCTQVPKHMHI